jgi:hypothetical protein
MSEISGLYLESDAIDSQVLTNNTFTKGRNNANSADVNMFKVNTSDKVEAGADLNMGSFNIITNGNVDGVDVSAKGTNVSNLVTLSGVAADSTHLGTFTGATIADSSTVKVALQALETKVESVETSIINFEWENSAKAYVVDNTIAPATEVLNDRYVLSHNGGSPHADWDGAAAGDIVQFNGTVWVKKTPALGTFISVDADATGVYYWGGAAWAIKYWEKTTASTGLTVSGYDVRLANASASNGISVTSGAISAVLNSAHLEIATNAISVKSNAIDETELYNADGHVDADSFVLPTGYTVGAGTVAAGDTINAAIQKLDGNIAAMATVNPYEVEFTLSAGDITAGYVECANELMPLTILVWPSNPCGPMQTRTTDWTHSVVSSKSRITWVGNFATKVLAGHKIIVHGIKV